MTPASPTKRRRFAAEAKARKTAPLRSLHIQMSSDRALDERGVASPEKTGVALGLPSVEAATLLGRKHLREGDLAWLEATAVHVGLPE